MENWFIWILLVLTVFVVFGFLIKQNLDSRIKIAFENEKKKFETKKEIQKMTLKELREFNGETNKKIYICINKTIFDVSENESYKLGGNYSLFAGRDATVCLGKLNFEEKYLDEQDYEGSLFYDEKDVMQDWL